jgi:hypothetical protein
MNSERIRRRDLLTEAWRAVVLFAAFLAVGVAAHAQVPDTTRPDTTRADTSGTVRDTTQGADSLAARVPAAPPVIDYGAPAGAMLHGDHRAGTAVITNLDMVWMRYFTAFDVVRDLLPALPLSQGSPGLHRAYSFAGAAPDAISTHFNGRPLRGVRSSPYELEFFPVEFAERIEVLSGARAALYGSGESLIAVNFVQPRFDVDGSYIRIWYAQSEHNLTGADITYARNVGSRSDLTVGFRRMPSDGEFTNQAVSGWSVRGSYRWRPSDALTLSLTEIFTDHGRGQNGGLTPASPRDPLQASVVNSLLHEDLLRHDVTLSGRWYPARSDVYDSSGLLVGHIPDTSLRIDGALYYTYAERELTLNEDQLVCRDRRDLLGLRGAVMLPLAFANLETNGIVEAGATGEPRIEAGGMLELPAGDLLAVRGGARLVSNDAERYTLFFGEASLSPLDSLSLRGGLRQRITIDEPATLDGSIALPDSVSLLSDAYTALLADASLDWRGGVWRAEATAFLRRAEPRATARFIDDHTVLGARLRLRLPVVWSLVSDNHLLVTQDESGDGRFPLVRGRSDLYGDWTLFNGNLDLRVGTALEYQSGTRGVGYLAGDADFCSDAGAFIFPDDPDRPLFTPFPLWSGYLQARIGTAFIRIAMKNILDAEFYSVYRYPHWARELNLMVTWALVD